MQLHNLQPATRPKHKKIVGRGGKRGKTSGKGGKGQTARAGHRLRPEIRDVIKKLPKLRGHNAPKIGRKPAVINISDLNKRFEDGASISPQSLGRRRVKILGGGELAKKFRLQGLLVSAGARAKIEKAGGTIEDE